MKVEVRQDHEARHNHNGYRWGKYRAFTVSATPAVINHDWTSAYQIFWEECYNIKQPKIKPEKQDKYKLKVKQLEVAKEQFIKISPELLKKYPGKYVAVTPQGQIGIGEDKLALFRKMIKKYGRTSIYLDKIGEEKRELRDRRKPRLLR